MRETDGDAGRTSFFLAGARSQLPHRMQHHLHTQFYTCTQQQSRWGNGPGQCPGQAPGAALSIQDHHHPSHMRCHLSQNGQPLALVNQEPPGPPGPPWRGLTVCSTWGRPDDAIARHAQHTKVDDGRCAYAVCILYTSRRAVWTSARNEQIEFGVHVSSIHTKPSRLFFPTAPLHPSTTSRPPASKSSHLQKAFEISIPPSHHLQQCRAQLWDGAGRNHLISFTSDGTQSAAPPWVLSSSTLAPGPTAEACRKLAGEMRTTIPILDELTASLGAGRCT